MSIGSPEEYRLSRKRPEARGAARGFTLIEVIVALAITALGLVAILAAARTGLGGTTLSGRYVEATRRAQSHLAEIGIAGPLVPGARSGDDGGGYSWRSLVAAPAVTPVPAGVPMPGLYDVEVDISWQDGGSVRGVTLRSQRFGYATAPHG